MSVMTGISVQQYITQKITRMLMEPPEVKTVGYIPASGESPEEGVEFGLHYGWHAAVEAAVELIGTDPQLAQITWTGGPNPLSGE